MTCDEVRDLLPEHLLGSLDDVRDAALRRHLRGCAACRQERAELEDGLSALARATHDQAPPAELREQILGTLREEWAEAPVTASRWKPSTAPPPETPSRPAWLSVAAVVAVIALAGSLLWGASGWRNADMVAADAQSYRSLLAMLGGKEFRIGQLHAADGSDLTGQVLVYDGDPSTGWQSWAVVFAKSNTTSTATPTLVAEDGSTRELPALKFSPYGDASSWLVTDANLTSFDRLTITAPDGAVLATASIRPA